MKTAVLLECALLQTALAETYDVVEPYKLAPSVCANGCASWADLSGDGNPGNQEEVDALWRNRTMQIAAGRRCAQPGLSPANHAGSIGGYSGTYCFCKGPLAVTDVPLGYCRSPDLVPEQINLQMNGPDAVVVAFVTFGDLASGTRPVVELSLKEDMSKASKWVGETRTYFSPDSDSGPQEVRKYNMHFVPVSGLAERTQYFYHVRAADGGDPAKPVPDAIECPGWDCTTENQFCPPSAPHATPPDGNRCCGGKWIVGSASCSSSLPYSDVLSFRSLYSSGPTRMGIFGDMGMMADGNTIHGGMLRDALNGDVDFFAHIGDHAYQMSSDDDRRGDGYMNAYQPLIGQVPWVPVVGNHEYYDNAHFRRFLNQTYGMHLCKGTASAHYCGRAGGCASQSQLDARHLGAEAGEGECVSADTALGTLLARGHGLASAVGGAVPSNTSRWYSKNVGLLHLVALDIMVYPGGEDTEIGGLEEAQRAWLEADLQAVDRTRTPWVLAMAHHPLYCSSTTMGFRTSEGDEERPGPSTATLHESQRQRLPKGKDFQGCIGTGEDFIARARASLEPLFLTYGVDVFFAGHEHNYESIFPVKHCAMGSSNCYIGDDFDKPQAPVHVVCGNGGVDGGDHFGSNWGPWTRKQLGYDTPGECTTLSSGGPTQSGCGAGYGRVVAHNATHLTYSYVLNVNSTIWDEWTIYQPAHGSFVTEDPAYV